MYARKPAVLDLVFFGDGEELDRILRRCTARLRASDRIAFCRTLPHPAIARAAVDSVAAETIHASLWHESPFSVAREQIVDCEHDSL